MMSRIPQRLTCTIACGWTAILIVGCQLPTANTHDDPSTPAGLESAGEFEPDQRTDSTTYDRPAERLIIELKVFRYTAPKGSFSGGEAVWKTIGGVVTDAATTLRLADNGFRAAMGRDSDRKPLADALGALPDVVSSRDDVTPDASREVELELGACPPRMSVFHFDAAGELHGLDFVEAKAMFGINLELRSISLRDVWMRVVPRLEEPPGPAKWVITQDGARQVPEERVRKFPHLAFETTIPDGGFLVLGPTQAQGQLPLVGGAFFSTQLPASGSGSSAPRESLFIISPIVRSVAARVPRTAAASE
jgi:hypothetical protein